MVTRNPLRSIAAGVRPAVVSLGTLACLPVASGAAAPAAPRNPISFYHLRSVSLEGKRAAGPSRPLEMNLSASGTGTNLYEFRDRRTGRTFRDGASVLSDFAPLAQAGKTRRAGALAYAVPAEFRGTVAGTPSTIYLTAAQRKTAETLRAELRAWRGLLAASPRILSASDLEPNAVAEASKFTKKLVVILTLTPAGSKKLADFSGKHKNEILAAVIDPDRPGSRLWMAPTVQSAITSPEMQLSGGFKTLAEAQKLAKRINVR